MSAATFQRFGGNKSLDAIRKQCEAAGVEFDDRAHEGGSDFIALRSPGALVMFSTVNGKFFGHTPQGVDFNSDDRLDGAPWFDALLRFFYVEKARK